MKKKALAAAALAGGTIAAAASAWYIFAWRPHALWRIVSGQCVPRARDGVTRNTCAKVDLNGGYAVLKDINGIGQYLLIPTARLEGIESPRLIETNAPNYWRAAWNARVYLERALHTQLAREDIGLAINSATGRSQDQLHIHIDCMKPEVSAALAAQRHTIGNQWRELSTPLSGHRYRARSIDDGDLSSTDPFKLLAGDIGKHGGSMADQTLLLTGATLANGASGFVLLNDRVQAGDRASSEELLDHTCGVHGQNARVAARSPGVPSISRPE